MPFRLQKSPLLVTLGLIACLWFVSRWSMGDWKEGTQLLYQMDLSCEPLEPSAGAGAVKEQVEKRLRSYYGRRRGRVAIEGNDKLHVELPEVKSLSLYRVRKVIERPGILSIRLLASNEEQNFRNLGTYQAEEEAYHKDLRLWAGKMRERAKKRERNPSTDEPQPQRPEPPEFIVRTEVEKVISPNGREEWKPKRDGRKVLLNRGGSYVEGKHLSHVEPTLDANTLKPSVSFQLDKTGAELMGKLTGENVGNLLAIVLDDEILEVARIQSRITDRGLLSGNFTKEEVRELVSLLRSGPLPAKLSLLWKRVYDSDGESAEE